MLKKLLKKYNDKLHIDGNSILLIWNRWNKNLGDELILVGLIKTLIWEWKIIVVPSYNKEWLEKFHAQFFNKMELESIVYITELPKGIRSFFMFLKQWWLRDIKHYWKADSMILGGGEILTEEKPFGAFYWILSSWIFLFSKTFQKNKNVYMMGGIQKASSWYNKKLFKYWLRTADGIFVRDMESYELLDDEYKYVKFFFDTSLYCFDNYKSTNSKLNEKSIVININKEGDTYLDQICEIIERHINNWYIVYFAPIWEWIDDKYFKIIKDKFHTNKNISNLKPLNWSNDIYAFFDKIKSTEKVFCTRLHLYLIARYLDTDVECFAYHKKIVKMSRVLEGVS